MRILKSEFEIAPLPYTMLRTDNIAWASFPHFYSTLLIGRTGEKHKKTVVPIIFVTDCLKNLQNFKCGILQLLILNQVESMYLPIASPLYNFS